MNGFKDKNMSIWALKRSKKVIIAKEEEDQSSNFPIYAKLRAVI